MERRPLLPPNVWPLQTLFMAKGSFRWGWMGRGWMRRGWMRRGWMGGNKGRPSDGVEKVY